MTRTTEELLKDVDEVAALDKERTQGQWKFSANQVGYHNVEDDDGCHLTGSVSCLEDTVFMAKSPHMAALIAELAAKLRNTTKQEEALEEALEEIRHCTAEGIEFPTIYAAHKIARKALQHTRREQRR